MKHYIIFSIFLLSISLSAQDINWVNLEEAEAEMKKSPEKPLFIDFYTDWCGWCKRMDNTTFKEQEVVSHINTNYIPVKFDAELKEEVKFKGKSYRYIKGQNGRGVNSFAYFSLRGQLSYPAYAIIGHDGKLEKLLLGYMPKDKLLEGLEATP
ncbi:MAG: thioredoxin family protein [Moheibacter sp.]